MNVVVKQSVAERVAQQCYGLSANPEAPENKNSLEWQAGHAVGMDKTKTEKGMDVIEREAIRRRLPSYQTPAAKAFE